MPLIQATQEDVRRFLSFVEPLRNGCWFYTGARSRGSGNKKWYPSFWVPSLKTTVRGHRFSSEVFNCDECPPGHHRDHNCNFSMCVNPEHIDVVTHEHNQALKVARQIEMRSERQFALLLARFTVDSSL